MMYRRTVTLAVGVVLFTAASALAQSSTTTPLPSPRSTTPTPSSPTLTPTPPVGVPSTVDPRTGLPSSQSPLDSRTGLPTGSDVQTDPRSGLPSTSPGVFTTPMPPVTSPPPVPQTRPFQEGPPAGQPITPSTVNPRTGLPRR
jgi:hypothetical protein